MGEIIQETFNCISLERDPKIWQSYRQDVAMTEKRINFLAEFEETLFVKDLDFTKSPCRKNIGLSNALLVKCEKSKDAKERIKLLTNALMFSTGEQFDSILRKRRKEYLEAGSTNFALNDLQALNEKTEEDTADIKELSCILTEIDDLHIENKNIEFKPHSFLKNFCENIQVKKETGRGRFLVAKKTIKPGEIIAMETSYAAVLDREYVGTNCDHCLVSLGQYVLASPLCSRTKYCSPGCQVTALRSHHRYESLVMDSLYRAGCGAWILAYRLVATKSLGEWREVERRLGEHNEGLGTEKGDIYDSEDILTVYNLVTHDSGTKREPPLLMKESLTALFFLRCLQSRHYFNSSPVKPGKLSSDEMFIARLLHHFMRVVFYNSHEVTELRPSEDSWSSNKIIKTGVAINPSLALINHSCDPNYARVERGITVTAFSTREIPAGAEILDVYSGTFVRSEMGQREEVHTRYNFQCRCEACTHEWPGQSMLPRNVTKKHLAEKITDVEVKKLDKCYKQVTHPDWLRRTPSQEVRSVTTRLLSHNILLHPHYLKYQTEDILHKSLWDIYGKMK